MEQHPSETLKTILYERHQELGAKMVDFCGWQMPLYYSGILSEHRQVRQHLGIFDVSHMGRVIINGPDAEPFLDHLSTNQLAGKPNGSTIYSVLTLPTGGCVDDLLLYKENVENYFAVVNCSNRQKDLAHFKEEAQAFRVEIETCYAEEGILAIQGPAANGLVGKLFPQAASIAPMHFVHIPYGQKTMILSHTGYTGAGGFEIYAPNALIPELWKLFLEEGKPLGIVPVGLGARDSLRLEMGYALYGHELSEKIAPNESVAAWTIKWKKGDFIGKAALLALEKSPLKRRAYGIVLQEEAIARAGHEVYRNGEKIGIVTSGAYSPSLNRPIALILVHGLLQPGDEVAVDIRQRRCRAIVTQLPFIKGTL